MRRLTVFNNVSLDGYFVDATGGMDFAHKDARDPEWDEFVSGNASGNGALLFGRVTYDMMAGFWPTPHAKAAMPAVAEGMNRMAKYVASRTMTDAAWNNTTVLGGDLFSAVRALKRSDGPDIVILALKPTRTRTFGNGSVLLCYEPALN
jgi:dihydrofolate reductase